MNIIGQVPIKHRNASVQVKDSWSVIEEMDFQRLPFCLYIIAV